MSLFVPSPTTVILPGQNNGTGAYNANYIDEFNGMVEQVIKRNCLSTKIANVRTVRGAQTIRKRSSGQSTIQKVTRGEAPSGTSHNFGQRRVTVDTVILTREAEFILEEVQNDFDARSELAQAQGEAHARKFDQAYFIQGLKAGLATSSPYGTDGFQGGTQVTLSASGDATDPSKLYTGICSLFTGMANKDVVPQRDDVALYMGPDQFYTLLQAEQIVNGEYVTSNGTSLGNMPIFKAFGCPVFMTTNIPFGKSITGHELSNTDNSNAYDGDFTKVKVLAMSPKAVFAGQSLPIQSKIWYSDEFLSHFVDSWASYGMTTDRTEYAGVIQIP